MFEVNVLDLRLDNFRFIVKKQASQKGSLFRLKFAMPILPTKPGHFSLKRGLVNGHFIVKWLYIYRQPECYFKLCYSSLVLLNHASYPCTQKVRSAREKRISWGRRFLTLVTSNTPDGYTEVALVLNLSYRLYLNLFQNLNRRSIRSTIFLHRILWLAFRNIFATVKPKSVINNQ